MNGTLIKWPGGKSREYKFIKNIIPSYERYIEPFFGGGGVFFQEKPEKAIINDYHFSLMEFYRLIKKQDPKLKKHLKNFEYNWDNLKNFIAPMEAELREIFESYREGKDTQDNAEGKISKLLELNLERFNGIFEEEFVVDRKRMFDSILKAVVAKIIRIKKVENNKGEKLNSNDVRKNIETGFRAGFYTHFRSIMNDCDLKRRDLPVEKYISIFYFIREFCYGSMFRYNSHGEFNIPYGGISYNQKDLKSKIKKLYNEEIKKIFSNTEIYDLDFEEFIFNINPNQTDFIFFDPPYDSDFSTYAENLFGKDDHERLANLIENLKAKCLLIIKRTDFIEGLYRDKGLNISSFGKLYTYNVRGRNNRETKHLIIKNF